MRLLVGCVSVLLFAGCNPHGEAETTNDLQRDLEEDTCPTEGLFELIGTECTNEGQSCGGENCTNPCQFCNLVMCTGGIWQRLEAHPMPPDVPFEMNNGECTVECVCTDYGSEPLCNDYCVEGCAGLSEQLCRDSLDCVPYGISWCEGCFEFTECRDAPSHPCDTGERVICDVYAAVPCTDGTMPIVRNCEPLCVDPETCEVPGAAGADCSGDDGFGDPSACAEGLVCCYMSGVPPPDGWWSCIEPCDGGEWCDVRSGCPTGIP